MRRAVLALTDYLLIEMLKKTFNKDRRIISVIENPLPDDVKIIRCGHDDIGTLRILLESDDFEDIEKGDKYPELEPPLLQSEEAVV